ncbi:putative transcription regulator SWI/SNF-BAF60b family [Helianthus annuus]|nr:putative transcription regulator SWI/SNF-BAF60b family [Helianthus annuus]KAJ0460913.1 putative transcription regulator SWI/SNF-BAF60b family [Helianthus annuus]KAJ0641340.1 putative transcription regulator SWI/SNF-BAF60b family [Helianthus annuus]KAJ0645241.1 putative transcription regulator SWI/SNF-BAF60b family [Helianthus annuus]
MVSDQELAKQIQILLTQSSFATLNDLVNHLSQTLGFDLSHKAHFIRDQINLLHYRLQSQPHNPPPPPPPLPVPAAGRPPVSVAGRPADQFSYQQSQFGYNQQVQQPHFVFQQQAHRPGHPVELRFGNPEVREQSEGRAVQEVKYEGVSVENAVWKSSEKLKKGGSGNKRRGGPGGLNKLCGISPELQVIVGESSLSRTDVCKQLWAYIKKNNLQDPGNKRKIICDDALRVVFETDCTDMFKMNKLLAKHIIPLEPTKETSRKKSKVNDEPKAESNDFVPSQVIISEALANCLDTLEREMSESEALRLVWEYIKVNDLEDPQNSVMVLCDEKLKELFGCETISAMDIPQFLVNHHLLKR